MNTRLSYLTAPECYQRQARMLIRGKDEKGDFIIPDNTPAYPQGGGQESDSGTLLLKGEVLTFTDVRLSDQGVKHYLLPAAGTADSIDAAFPPREVHVEAQSTPVYAEEAIIEITVDEERRRRNSILHTSGHLLASIVFIQFPGMIPSKGHHFSSGSYIELTGDLAGDPEEIRQQIQSAVDKEIRTAKAVTCEMVSPEALKQKSPFLQPDIPANKALRIVNIETYFPIACGGTHVQRLNEIPRLSITKFKYNKDTLKISYRCF